MIVAYFEVMVGLDLYHIIAAFEFDCIVAAFGSNGLDLAVEIQNIRLYKHYFEFLTYYI